jgi:hypothetical protein
LQTIKPRRVENAARRRLLLDRVRADRREPHVARTVAAAGVDDDVGGDSGHAGIAFDLDAGDAGWCAGCGEQSHDGRAFDDADAVALRDVTPQQVLEHHATAREETDVLITGLEHRIRKTGSRQFRKAEFLRAGLEQPPIEIRRVCLDELDERREQHVAVPRLRGAAPIPFIERVEMVARHRSRIALDARDRVSAQSERQRGGESGY